MAFPSISQNSTYYLARVTLGEDNMNVFGVPVLHADGDALGHRNLRSHFRTVEMPHTEWPPSIQKAQ